MNKGLVFCISLVVMALITFLWRGIANIMNIGLTRLDDVMMWAYLPVIFFAVSFLAERDWPAILQSIVKVASNTWTWTKTTVRAAMHAVVTYPYGEKAKKVWKGVSGAIVLTFHSIGVVFWMVFGLLAALIAKLHIAENTKRMTTTTGNKIDSFNDWLTAYFVRQRDKRQVARAARRQAKLERDANRQPKQIYPYLVKLKEKAGNVKENIKPVVSKAMDNMKAAAGKTKEKIVQVYNYVTDKINHLCDLAVEKLSGKKEGEATEKIEKPRKERFSVLTVKVKKMTAAVKAGPKSLGNVKS